MNKGILFLLLGLIIVGILLAGLIPQVTQSRKVIVKTGIPTGP